MKTSDPARDFAAYTPSYRWYKTDTYFHEVQYGFRFSDYDLPPDTLTIDVSVYRDFGATRWTAEVNVTNGPTLVREAVPTKREAQVWAECAIHPAAEATADYRAFKAEQARAIQPLRDAVAESQGFLNEATGRQREDEAAFLDSRSHGVTIPSTNFDPATT